MSSELIGIFATGAALAGLMVGLVAWLRADMRSDLAEHGERLARIEGRVTEHGERLARIEGLLEGLGLRRGDALAPRD
ncbi:MAG: hypothetical protein OXN89_00955 [Bryobacterales bacterium]|nr:hypothetical protein [Bryobacterales bacterium]